MSAILSSSGNTSNASSSLAILIIVVGMSPPELWLQSISLIDFKT